MKAFFYPVYGKVLRSQVRFPELWELPHGSHRWDFRLVDALPDPWSPELLGEESIEGMVCARFFRHRSGFRIEVDDAGVFDLSTCGTEIRCRPVCGPGQNFRPAHLLERVLATSLHLDGIVTLRGSAVQMGDGVVAFLAERRSAASNLALLLSRAGARFVADAALPVEFMGGVPLAWPGAGSGGWNHDWNRDTTSMDRPTRISAIYLLHSAGEGRSTRAVRRTALDKSSAVERLLSEMTFAQILGHGPLGVRPRNARAITAQVPVSNLSVVRNPGRMNEVADQLIAWHDLPRLNATVLPRVYSEDRPHASDLSPQERSA